MRILILYPELLRGKGGIQVYNKFLAGALRDLGHNLKIVSINDRSVGSPVRYFRKANFSLKVLQQAVLFRPDLILCGHVHFSPLCFNLKRFLKIPYVTFTYGVDIANVGEIERRALRDSIKVVCISNHTRQLLIRQNVEEEKVFLLPNTFDSERFEPKPRPAFLAERWKIERSEIVFLTVARLRKNERYKGYDKVILALKEVVTQIPNVKYVLVGEGDDLERIRLLISENHLTDKVILPGFVSDEDLPHYYNLSDAFVMPSSGEGFGFVFLEAAACGRPVIAGNKDGSVDAVCDGKLGLLVDPESIPAIANAMTRIATRDVDSNLLDSSFLRNEVVRKFGMERFKEGVGNLLHNIQNSNGNA